MFKSDNVDNMNVTTTFFAGRPAWITLVTRDGQPWDFVVAESEEVAKMNHTMMIYACSIMGDVIFNVTADTSIN